MENINVSYLDKYNLWKTDDFFDKDTQRELDKITDDKEIEDRFYCDLNFGTGGLRGIMGAGTNRMNQYTVGKATTGFGNYLLDTKNKKDCEKKGVVIAYDTRKNSYFFAEKTAQILSGMGIYVYLHETPCPTPQLSFAVKKLGALAGIVITASHNPKDYNGYKIYDEEGCQIVPKQAKQIISYINKIEDYRSIGFQANFKFIKKVNVTDDFIEAVLQQSRIHNSEIKKNLRVVYTPLHGTGKEPVLETLKRDGFTQINLLEEQAVFDGEFSTVVSPNPEDRRALEMGIQKAKLCDADIVLGTDPDCDRVGVAVKKNTDYQLLTGNQVGALLTDFVLNNTNFNITDSPAIIKTIVTSDLGAEIAKKKGLTVFSTLTGFKYVGEKITQFEKAKKEKDKDKSYNFIIGYEESYGYLVGTHARDKDGVVASLLICEMAAEYKKQNKTLLDKLNELYSEYGYYYDTMDSFKLAGKEGLEKIENIMKKLRENPAILSNIQEVTDYSTPIPAEKGFGFLPASNVMKYTLNDGTWIAVRPSGTEPKLKIYYSVKGKDKIDAESKFLKLQTDLLKKMGLYHKL